MYAVSGDGQANSIHTSHRENPAVAEKLKSICILDGNSPVSANEDQGTIKLPGNVPESEVFDFVRQNIDRLAMQLAVALHLPPEKDTWIRDIVQNVSRSNRDPHLLFSQVGKAAGLIPGDRVASAFIGLWISENKSQADRIADFVLSNLDAN